MRALISAALLCAAGPAIAQTMIAREGENWIRLSTAPCHAEVVAAVPEAKGMSAASVMFNGQQYKACWTLRGPQVFLRYEDTDAGLIPLQQFKQDNSAT